MQSIVVLLRAGRSAKEQWFSARESAMAPSVSNVSTSRCNPLLENVDSGAPEVFGINLAVWAVSVL